MHATDSVTVVMQNVCSQFVVQVLDIAH